MNLLYFFLSNSSFDDEDDEEATKPKRGRGSRGGGGGPGSRGGRGSRGAQKAPVVFQQNSIAAMLAKQSQNMSQNQSMAKKKSAIVYSSDSD